MKITVCENITIDSPTVKVKEWCKDNLVIDNPDFYKLERLGKWTGRTPKTIQLYETRGDRLIIPFGCINDIWKLHPVMQDYIIALVPNRKLTYNSCIQLYSYQKEAVEAALRLKNGILIMPCGAGKTQSGLEIIARVGGRALWLTHTKELLEQSKARAESVFDLDEEAFGTITAGKVNIGTHITFATVQTMCRLNLSEYKDMWDIIIVDEVQHVAGSPTRVTQFYKVLSSLRARYKIGLTATPKRADGLERSMFAIMGDKIHEVYKEQLEGATCPIKAYMIDTGWSPEEDVTGYDGIIDYNLLINSMIHDQKRLKKVCGIIESLDGGTIVLANRIEYLHAMQKASGKKSICISGVHNAKTKEVRKKALQMLNEGEIEVIYATYALAKEGLDVPSLKYVVFATPEKDSTTVIQAAGRVGRRARGKDYGVVIDMVDDFGIYYGWAKKRKTYYKKIGAEVIQ